MLSAKPSGFFDVEMRAESSRRQGMARQAAVAREQLREMFVHRANIVRMGR